MKRTLASYCWAVAGFTVLVILWGAFVRASGSGAGCGSHWPLCNGEVLPRSPGLETLIELTHRLTSGILGLLVLALVVAAFRVRPSGHPVRTGAVSILVFVVLESAVGAGLVKFEWVADNASMERVYVMAFHLVNTMLLVAAVVITAWLASPGRRLEWRGRGRLVAALAVAASGLLLTGMSGAVTALGDTLVLFEGVSPESSPVVASLLASRIYHPSTAFVAAGLLLFGLRRAVAAAGDRVRPVARALVVAMSAQLALGFANVWLKAPIWMQLVHLAVSNLIWILFLVAALEALSDGAEAKKRFA